jgi:hypothetical protein
MPIPTPNVIIGTQLGETVPFARVADNPRGIAHQQICRVATANTTHFNYTYRNPGWDWIVLAYHATAGGASTEQVYPYCTPWSDLLDDFPTTSAQNSIFDVDTPMTDAFVADEEIMFLSMNGGAYINAQSPWQANGSLHGPIPHDFMIRHVWQNSISMTIGIEAHFGMYS